MAHLLLDALTERRAEIFADEKTPVRVFRLAKPAGRMRHLVVLSPEATNAVLIDAGNRAHYAMARSLFEAFPAHENEMTGEESVGAAEAKVRGREALRTGHWDRVPPP